MIVNGTYGSIEIRRGKLVVKSVNGDGEGGHVPVEVAVPIEDVIELLSRSGYVVRERGSDGHGG